MKVRELIIGDWVLLDGKATQIDIADLVFLDGCKYGDERYEPIPLSEKILKKNGFTKSNEHWYFKRVRENGVFDVCVSLDYKEIEITKVCGAGTDEEEADYGTSIELGYDVPLVHKFQQTLRCTYNLTEFADNFKV